jgi:hypothetical protein
MNGESVGTQHAEVAFLFGLGQGRFIEWHMNSKEEKGWDADFHE